MALNAGYSYPARVGPAHAGSTVLQFLTAEFDHSPASVWSARIEAGEVECNGRPADALSRIRAGDVIIWHRPPWDEPSVPLEYAELFVDDALVAVHKPAGLPTLPAGGFLAHTLWTLVRGHYPEATPMHRLGRETSGIVLFARTGAARSRLQRDWREHAVRKTYRALASGRIDPDRCDIHTPIGPVDHAPLGQLFAAHTQGKPSHSRVRVLERRPHATLVEVDITTGRPHQIRIHLASIGHPLVGDPLYVAGGVPQTGTTALPGDGGYLLHALRLEFTHPIDGTQVRIEAPAPDTLRPG